MKKKRNVMPILKLGTNEILLKMKLLTFMLFAAFVSASASSYSQGAKFNLNMKDVTISDVFRKIEEQSEFVILFNEKTLNIKRKVDVAVENETVDKVLDQIFDGDKYAYKIFDRQIAIYPDEIKELSTFVKAETNSEQQKNELSGTVKDSKGLPLPGVTVVVKGTTIGTITDNDGKYKLSAPTDAKILMFSFVGMKKQEIPVPAGSRAMINVTLEEEIIAIEEVVAIGYDDVPRSALGGTSISTVKVADLQKAPVKSFEESLAGRVAGVQITSSEGGPLSTNSIVIRGNNSITQGNSPLWVVDGFPLESSSANTIDPSSIKSITVLKDAASTAIYGSRGSNGVIVVTTTQGQSGAPVVRFDGYYGFQKTLKLMNMMDPYEYVKLQLELVGYAAKVLYTPGDPTLEDPTLEDPSLDDYIPGGRTLDNYKNAPYNNWQKLLYRTAPIQNYSLSVSGGTDKNNYMISGSMTDQQGTIIKTGFKRYQGRVVFNQDVNKKARLNLNVNYANTSTEGSSPSVFPTGASASYSLLYAVWGYRPAISPNSSLEEQLNSGIDPDGQLEYAYNPVISARNTDISSDTHNLAANAYIDYKLTNDLVFRISGGVNYNQRLGREYYGVNTSRGMAGSLMGPNGRISNSASTILLNENTLTYKKLFKQNHYLNLLAGFSVQKTNTNSSSAQASQVPNDELGVSGLDEGTPYAIGSASSNNFLNSYFGRVNYNYKSKYFLTGVVRADGSSKFAPGNRWGYFPSGAIAWNVAKENFMKPVTNLVSELKFRGSYGVSGNNRISDFAYLSAISLSDITTSYPFENVYERGAVQSSLANRDLKWETTATTDIGLDLGLIENRVELTVDYYKKVTSDLLLQATTPGHIGYTSALKNIGKIENTGLEFTLNTVNVTSKKFSWDSNFNISFNRNKVLELTSDQTGMVSSVYFSVNPVYSYLAEVGGPISQIIGYKWLGNYQYEDFDQLPNGTYVLKGNIPDNGTTRAAIRPGDIKYKDINGDGTVNDADRMVIGNPNPLFTGGFSNNFQYLGFDMNVVLSFSYGNDVLNANRILFEGSPQSYLNNFATYVNRWTPENPTNEYPRAGGTKAIAVSNRVVEDGSFLRLKTVSLGYKLPSALLQKVHIRQARVYCSAQNLAVWTNYSGSDPEVSTRSGALVQGFDFSSYPRAFTLTMGFNLTF